MTAKQKKALAFLMVYLLGYLALFIHFTSVDNRTDLQTISINDGVFYRHATQKNSTEMLVFIQNKQTYITPCPRLKAENENNNFCEHFPTINLPYFQYRELNFPTLPFTSLQAQIVSPTKLDNDPAYLIIPLQFSYTQNNQPKTFAISDKSYQSIVDFNHSIRWFITLLVLIIAFVIFHSYFKAEIHHWFETKFPWFKRFRKKSPQIK